MLNIWDVCKTSEVYFHLNLTLSDPQDSARLNGMSYSPLLGLQHYMSPADSLIDVGVCPPPELTIF